MGAFATRRFGWGRVLALALLLCLYLLFAYLEHEASDSGGVRSATPEVIHPEGGGR
jgi:hypothetical protein